MTSEIPLGQIDRLAGLMIRDVHKINLSNNHFYGDGESIAGIILRTVIFMSSRLVVEFEKFKIKVTGSRKSLSAKSESLDNKNSEKCGKVIKN